MTDNNNKLVYLPPAPQQTKQKQDASLKEIVQEIAQFAQYMDGAQPKTINDAMAQTTQAVKVLTSILGKIADAVKK